MTTIPFDAYVRRAALARVIDGDSVVLRIDLGWHITAEYPVRLLGVNSPEKRGITNAAGVAAQDYTQGWFERYLEPGPWPFMMRSEKLDKYGRSLGTVWTGGGAHCLNTDLLEAGHAVVYP